MSNGPLDFMFDVNGNGELDPIEEAMLIDFLDEMQKGGFFGQVWGSGRG